MSRSLDKTSTNRKNHTKSTTKLLVQPPFYCVVKSFNKGKPKKSSSFASYDLSKEENIFNGHFSGPMKSVSVEQKQILESGKRNDYLTMRYDHSPDTKYNFPEATSWRYGWLHNVNCKKI
ncbi:uncharacterized protein LOC129919255 [Episyrphus balteatus]|uniref:uncharacterized protein LOC129919255 n=1 Tax=Episyrphus balteatus TaxID=286459 RepID=UPI002486AFAF|nr:uncharacterized protein LOC129919255 [Episyrphus balteatus]